MTDTQNALREFETALSAAINAALKKQTPLRNIIMVLEDHKFQMQLFLAQVEMERQAQEMTKKILPVNGDFKIPPGLSGIPGKRM
jgi:hypothetical protein